MVSHTHKNREQEGCARGRRSTRAGAVELLRDCFRRRRSGEEEDFLSRTTALLFRWQTSHDLDAEYTGRLI